MKIHDSLEKVKENYISDLERITDRFVLPKLYAFCIKWRVNFYSGMGSWAFKPLDDSPLYEQGRLSIDLETLAQKHADAKALFEVLTADTLLGEVGTMLNDVMYNDIT